MVLYYYQVGLLSSTPRKLSTTTLNGDDACSTINLIFWWRWLTYSGEDGLLCRINCLLLLDLE